MTDATCRDCGAPVIEVDGVWRHLPKPDVHLPDRVQMSRQHPWREGHKRAVIVARPTRWGNPFSVGATVAVRSKEGSEASVFVTSRTAAVAFYETWLVGLWEIPGTVRPTAAEIRDWLRGSEVACWCPLDGPCHGDVLLAIAIAIANR